MIWISCVLCALASDPAALPEERALAFLVLEVPRWSAENRCYSCHNNGDAARALYEAARRPDLASLVPARALADTTAWLLRPEGWDHNGGEGPFSDKRLATIEFAAALSTAVATGRVTDKGPLRAAGRRLVAAQADDGSFPIDGPDTLGTPATYGRPLATAMTLRTLRIADAPEFREPLRKAASWLADRPIRNTLDAASVLLALEGSDNGPSRQRTVDLLRRGQGTDGGWGPYVDSPAEVFDSALALLALVRWRQDPDISPLIRHGRAFLIATQQTDGAWPGTTRPSGGDSYAQRVSTAGWATLALLETR